jgi:hypothetical protein
VVVPLPSLGMERAVERALRAVLNQARILWNVLRANTNEVPEIVFRLIFSLRPGLHAVDHVFGELGALTVAVRSRVVLAVSSGDLEPRIHASWENVWDFNDRVAREARAGCLRRAGAGRDGDDRACCSGRGGLGC